MRKTSYFVVPAPGHYGDRARVLSAHYTLPAALRAASPGYVARKGALERGSIWFRVYESVYPMVRA